MLRPPDPLEKRGDAPRRSQLTHELNGTDVDAEFQRSRRNDRPELSGAKAGLDPEAAVHGKAPVVSLDAVLTEAIGELVSHPFGHPAGIDEHKGRPVALDVRGYPLEHRVHLLERRNGAELVVRQLDGHVERSAVADVDDGATRLAVGQGPVGSGTDQKAGDRRYRPLGR